MLKRESPNEICKRVGHTRATQQQQEKEREKESIYWGLSRSVAKSVLGLLHSVRDDETPCFNRCLIAWQDIELFRVCECLCRELDEVVNQSVSQ